MSKQQPPESTSETSTVADEHPPLEEVLARNELLREENQRMRDLYARTRRTEYRRAAQGLGLCGVLAALGGFAFPATRATLFALAGIGVFTAILTYYLTPERFVAASVGERTYTARAMLGDKLIAELGLQDEQIYVPSDAATSPAPVTLFIPQHANYTLPDEAALESVVVVPPDEHARGVALPPTGAALYQEFDETMTDTIATTPADRAAQLADAVSDGFELVDDAVVDAQPADGQVSIGIRGSAFGAVDRVDHPVVSFLASGLAVGMESPVRVDTVATDDDRFDYRLTFRWDAESTPHES